MKYITPLALGVLALALCGCSTDNPVLATPATQAVAVKPEPGAGPSAAEEVHDIDMERTGGASLVGSSIIYGDPNKQTPIEMQTINPYGH